MSLCTREQHALSAVEAGLRRSAPGLAAHMAAFNQFNAGEETSPPAVTWPPSPTATRSGRTAPARQGPGRRAVTVHTSPPGGLPFVAFAP
jgi:hypothetical protein